MARTHSIPAIFMIARAHFVLFHAHARMEGWYVDSWSVCRSLYVEVLVPTQKHKLCQTFTKTAILDEQIWVEI